MSKSALATLLAMALSWVAVSCAGPMSGKPAVAGAPAKVPASVAAAAAAVPSASAATPGTPAVSAGAAPVVAAASPWNYSSIFFLPALVICITFGISFYMSASKPG
jgi:hypothetical protein